MFGVGAMNLQRRDFVLVQQIEKPRRHPGSRRQQQMPTVRDDVILQRATDDQLLRADADHVGRGSAGSVRRDLGQSFSPRAGYQRDRHVVAS